MVVDWLASPDVVTVSGFWTRASCWALFFILVWFVFAVAFRFASSGQPIYCERCGTWALKSMMLCHHCVVGPTALAAIWQDTALRGMYLCLGCSDVAEILVRDPSGAGPCLAAQALIPVTAGYMAADLLLLSQWKLTGKGQTENIIMILHHVLSLMSWPCTLYYDFCSRYILVLLSYELTSCFLILNWMLSTAGQKNSFAYIATGGAFTVMFVLMRMLGSLPQVVAMANAPPWRSPPPRLSDLPPWTLWGSMWLVIPVLLNMFWGVKVVKGFLGVVFKKSKHT